MTLLLFALGIFSLGKEFLIEISVRPSFISLEELLLLLVVQMIAGFSGCQEAQYQT